MPTTKKERQLGRMQKVVEVKGLFVVVTIQTMNGDGLAEGGTARRGGSGGCKLVDPDEDDLAFRCRCGHFADSQGSGCIANSPLGSCDGGSY